jgi:hypothetical protein
LIFCFLFFFEGQGKRKDKSAEFKGGEKTEINKVHLGILKGSNE